MREDLPFTVIRAADNEVLARVANLLLARELFRVIANVNFPDTVLLKQGARIIETSAERR